MIIIQFEKHGVAYTLSKDRKLMYSPLYAEGGFSKEFNEVEKTPKSLKKEEARAMRELGLTEEEIKEEQRRIDYYE